MTYKELKMQTRETATYPKDLANTYLILGLRGEYGELCDKFKKLIRDDGWNPQRDPWGQKIPDNKKEGIMLELGDLAWYIIRYTEENEMYQDIQDYEKNEIQDIIPGTFNRAGILYNLDILKFAISELGGYASISALNAINNIANYLGYTIDDVFQMNYKKLMSRKMRDKIGGSGDYR